jgi:phosphoserine phosphatase RsbU/P
VGPVKPTDAELLTLLDEAPCGFICTTVDGTVLQANRTFLSWTGRDIDTVVGHPFVELLTRGGRIFHETHIGPMLRMQGMVREIAVDLACIDGQTLPILLNASVRPAMGSSTDFVAIVLIDARERRGYERELLAARRRAELSEEHARSLVTTLQRMLIPPPLADVRGLDVAARYRPAGTGSEVGGDFYDLFQVEADTWALVIGDVTGKGVEAAIVTALVRHTLRDLIVAERSPAAALATLNQVLRHSADSRFCTVCLALLRRQDATWEVTVSSGGHPLPVLLRPGRPAIAVGRFGRLLGAVEDVRLHDTAVELARDDRLVFYTDGVTDGRRDNELYGEARMLSMLAEQAPTSNDLVDALLADCLDFQNNHARDDIAVVAVRATL